MKYVCKREHIRPDYRMNYITRMSECSHHHCNALVVTSIQGNVTLDFPKGSKVMKDCPTLWLDLS